MIEALARLLRPRTPADLSHWKVTVYTREGCGCCLTAMGVLEPLRARHGFTLETIDIDTSPDLIARYGLEVPVVAIDGKVRFKGKIIPELLDRLIEAEGRP
jgi:glutaredoxin